MAQMKTQSAFVNPITLPEQLNAAEQGFADCMARGKKYIISEKCPAEAVNIGENANVVRADVIRFFAWGGNKTYPIAGNVIHLEGAWVPDYLSLLFADIPYALSFFRCHFAGQVSIFRVKCRDFYMDGAYLAEGLVGDGAQISGNLSLRNGFAAEENVRLINAKIDGDLDMDNGKFKGEKGDALTVERITVRSNVFMTNGFSAEGGVNMHLANVGKNMNCNKGVFMGNSSYALLAQNTQIGGDLCLNTGFSANGGVSLRGARIGGNLNCNGGTFKNSKGSALFASGIKVGGDLRLQSGFSTEGAVDFSGATVGGNMDCDDATLQNGGATALIANGMTVDGDIYLSNRFSSDRFSAMGAVHLIGANVGGSLNCDGALLKSGQGAALKAGGIKIGRNLSLQRGFSAEGGVDLFGAFVGGDMECNRSSFINEKGERVAFSADRVKVNGNLSMQSNTINGVARLRGSNISGNMSFNDSAYLNGAKEKEGEEKESLMFSRLRLGGNLSMQNNFSAEGAVHLNAANIGGNFFCDGKFARTLSASRITVGGNLLMQTRFSAQGDVLLSAANIGGNVDCDGCEFKRGLNAQAAKIKDSLVWRNIKGSGTVNLSSATADVLHDGEESREKFDFVLYGFSYARFANYADVKSRIRWLEKQPKGESFSPQPFEQAARVLFATGYNSDARDILLKKEQQLTQKGQLSRWRKFVRKSWSVFAGYGYQFWKTLLWSAAFIAAGAVIFWCANENNYIAPHQPVTMAYAKHYNASAATECRGISRPTKFVTCLFPEYPQFNAVMYSADVFIPFFALHQEPYWYPLLRNSDNYFGQRLYVIWHWIEIIAGWVLTSLFLLSITGLLRPRQTSGKE